MDDLKIPVRTELTVLPADDPNRPPLNWVVKEYNGVPAYRYLPEYEENGFSSEDLKPLTAREDLKPGDQILIPALIGGYHRMTIEEGDGSLKDGTLMAKTGHSAAFLRFGEDDRKCWVATGMINLRGLAKLSVSRETA